MPGQKRKASPARCECGKHDNNIQCEKEAKLETHLAVTAKIILFSPTVNIFVGKDNQVFSIHKDLLMIHSQYFVNRFREAGQDGKVALQTIKGSLFLNFVSWLYTGKFLEVSNEALGGGPRTDELWELGNILKVPTFQNMCMDDCRTYCQDDSVPWPFIEGVETMYKVSGKGSVLRKFAAHSMACKSPFEQHDEGSKPYEDWEALVTEYRDIAIDMAVAAGKNWNGTLPWDDENRAAYMVEEVPLEDAWDKYILSTRTKAEIKKEAKAKCIRSIIELEHLEREK